MRIGFDLLTQTSARVGLSASQVVEGFDPIEGIRDVFDSRWLGIIRTYQIIQQQN